ncbi:MAG: tRNA (adenosine(37)-N6)-threonylcarbamoyltransferase complex ATPase subunit type 1 TsaE [bacterium]|nr:tRNA (adenosine(37)-N6)-threonylcarbamoyltransferase complex ATPase subunit type 1 TsaE [bacterium]
MQSISERFEIEVGSPDETKRLGERLGRMFRPGDVVSLVGELGTGKTTLIQGIAKGLCVQENVSSASFVLMQEYKGSLPLYHFDLYRIENEEDIGYEDWLYGSGVSVLEWGEKALDHLPFVHLKIVFSYLSQTSRSLLFVPKGEHFLEMINRLLEKP